MVAPIQVLDDAHDDFEDTVAEIEKLCTSK